jgi:hypothetical protein
MHEEAEFDVFALIFSLFIVVCIVGVTVVTAVLLAHYWRLVGYGIQTFRQWLKSDR